MRKPKGQAVNDKFYYKVQSAAVKSYIDIHEKPVVTDWSDTAFFLTFDRVSFYLIPRGLYCLTENFYEPCDRLFSNQIFMENLYLTKNGLDLYEIGLTGNQKAIGYGDVILELYDNTKNLYVKQSSLEFFPKNIKFCKASISTSPVFIVSSLNSLLGGVYPLNNSKNMIKELYN